VGLFRFKQFSIQDDGAAMKVGTDAVLLGAWCPVGNAKRLLDIGTGSGVIALMLAQRSAPDAHIDAVERSAEDAAQAAENVRQSPWPDKVTVVHGAIQDYLAAQPYDVIVCNPPFFSQSLLPPGTRRREVRHDTHLSRQDLLGAIGRWLHPAGTASIVLPPVEAADFTREAVAQGLHLVRVTHFHTRLTKPAERHLMDFARATVSRPEKQDLVLYAGENIQSSAYRDLTADFYL
jgi:tRNA1Val (adenine37-N6)-methyltransferase